jgi:hypothetical protein
MIFMLIVVQQAMFGYHYCVQMLSIELDVAASSTAYATNLVAANIARMMHSFYDLVDNIHQFLDMYMNKNGRVAQTLQDLRDSRSDTMWSKLRAPHTSHITATWVDRRNLPPRIRWQSRTNGACVCVVKRPASGGAPSPSEPNNF